MTELRVMPGRTLAPTGGVVSYETTDEAVIREEEARVERVMTAREIFEAGFKWRELVATSTRTRAAPSLSR